ncbi:hypothetical protein [Sulfitobacter pontiacus]|uniref:hypothetical protein n=1 Tax=Sulfitobacter pontiacus TaxID=60137 RepID=UPI0036DF314A
MNDDHFEDLNWGHLENVSGSGQKKYVDPKQLQTELQRAFDAVGKRTERLENMILMNIQVHNLVLRAFVDLELVEMENLLNGLSDIKSRQADVETKAVLNAMRDSLISSQQTDNSQPHLRLVPKSDKDKDK